MRLLWKILFRRWRDVEQTGENIWAFFCGFHLARRMENSGIKHIHASWANGPATAAWVASVLTGIPFSFSARAGDIYPQDGALADKIDAAVFVRSDNRVNVDYLAPFAGSGRYKICAVYNPLPMRGAGEAAVRMSPPIQILAAGRLVRIKGFSILLRAVADLRDRGEFFHVTLVGDGWLRIFLKRQIRRLSLEENVSLPGFVTYERMSGYYERSDLFVMPSVVVNGGDRDGLPTVILEAMAHRLPVIASDICGIKEVVIPNRTGWLVPPADPAALADAIQEAIRNRERALALACAGRALVLAEFDPARNVDKMAELLANASAGA
jgi:glycosyltransferase involved in cell wall biosynthesis